MSILFKDRSPEECFTDKAFAYEAECAIQDSKDLNLMLQKNIFRDYSSRIWEAEGVHELDDAGRATFLEFMKKTYEFALPWGRNGYTSGGNHFHIFYDPSSFEELMQKPNAVVLESWMTFAPLYAKYYDGRWFNRRNGNARTLVNQNDDYDDDYEGNDKRPESGLSMGSKGRAVTGKECYTSTDSDPEVRSIEYRLNNVLDPRLYGYYLACTIAWALGRKPAKPESYEKEQKFYALFDGIPLQVMEGSTTFPEFVVHPFRNFNYDNDRYGHMDFRGISNAVPNFDIRAEYAKPHGVAVSEEIVKANLVTLLEILLEFGKVKSHAGLVSYLEEYGIPYATPTA